MRDIIKFLGHFITSVLCLFVCTKLDNVEISTTMSLTNHTAFCESRPERADWIINQMISGADDL